MVTLLARHKNDLYSLDHFYFYILFIASGHRMAAWQRIA
ncbi:hypothetical protein BS732_3285 [Bacillus subtilis MB73/2]|uniref:Uncharacterized protein n=1 Tax=Bacillus subtilis TaxID=1423 RepID=A0A0D1IUQ4_BACIU|nr:hypothetical protein BS732_3285 [Bacillus subtilis MB73/2]KIU13033.1 hypothetical protein SC09_Contig17orf00175 [Bacillus subtilis]